MTTMKKMMMTVITATALSLGAYASDTVATINGMPVTKSEMAQLFEMLGQKDKIDWSKLDKAKKEEYVRMYAPNKVMAARAEKELSKEEKEAVLAGYWMQKKLQEIKVSDKEIKEAYETIKKQFMQNGSDTNGQKNQFPPIEMLKPQIEMKLKQDKLIESLMKDVKIEVR
jgi:hypothetical protein